MAQWKTGECLQKYRIFVVIGVCGGWTDRIHEIIITGYKNEIRNKSKLLMVTHRIKNKQTDVNDYQVLDN